MSGSLNLYNSDIIVFNAFDFFSKKLLYTKYNFNFAKYRAERYLPNTIDNLIVFKNFLAVNESTWDKPHTVKPELVRYFNPINDTIVSYMNTYGNTIHKYYTGDIYNTNYLSQEALILNQFNLMGYDDNQIRLVQDFYVEDETTGAKYTKWNFNFTLYSNTFKVWGSKLLIFTDFIYRCMNIANQTGIINNGYTVPDQFKKFFFEIPLLEEYIKYYGVTSPYSFVYKSVANVNWTKYAPIVGTTVALSKKHFYATGQFELIKMSFNYKPLTNFKSASNFVVDIINNGSTCSGFLYRPHIDKTDTNIYIVTCYHILSNSNNLNTIRAVLNLYNDNYNSTMPITMTAEFEVIGYDIFSDVLVAKYNSEIPYNVSNKVDLTVFSNVFSNITNFLDFNGGITGKDVFTTTNMGSFANHSCYKGTIIDNKFSGFNNYTYTLAPPDSLIVYFDSQVNSSGSPVFSGNPDSTDVTQLKFVGMINSRCQNLEDHTQCISFFNLYNIVNTIIKKQVYFNSLSNDNYVIKNYMSKYYFNHKWLGIIFSYFNVDFSTKKFPKISNLYYNGGIIIEKFIIGFNYNTKKFVSDELELSQLNTIRLETPLLKTMMYRRYIESSKTPIVIKSISFFNPLKSEFKPYYFGKYGEQESFSAITYDFESLTTIVANEETFYTQFDGLAELPENLLFKYFSLYGLMNIEYYYYDTTKWVLDKETVGGNDVEWFNTYKDRIGNTYFQHKFEYPYILTPYLNIYEDPDRKVPGGVIFAKTNAKKMHLVG